jgi:predicted nuclease with TOPRIM domain
MAQANFEEKVLQALDELKSSDEQLKTEFTGLKAEFTRLEDQFTRLENSVGNFNERFGNYQQATQWVVQLAFSLIATATVTIIISTVVRR